MAKSQDHKKFPHNWQYNFRLRLKFFLPPHLIIESIIWIGCRCIFFYLECTELWQYIIEADAVTLALILILILIGIKYILKYIRKCCAVLNSH